MYLCDCYFYGKQSRVKSIYSISDLIEFFCSSLLKNGNIYGNYLITELNDSIRISFFVPEKNSLSKKYLSTYTNRWLEEIKIFYPQPPKFVLTHNKKYGKSVTDLSKEKSLYLFTHFLDDTSPVCSGKNGNPIPLYVLFVSDTIKEKIYFWMQEYKSLDRIYIYSGELEIPAYKQLAEYESGLSKEGRKLCKIIEEEIKKPVFYYLHRYWGRKIGEENRVCPSCGKNWKKKLNKNTKIGIDCFHFICKSCRLVSHQASTFDNERLARIGEFKNNKKK